MQKDDNKMDGGKTVSSTLLPPPDNEKNKKLNEDKIKGV